MKTTMKYCLVDDMNIEYREMFPIAENQIDETLNGYSGYYIVSIMEFDSIEQADEYCRKYNGYENEPDVHCNCCSEGCTMTAWEYAHWNKQCAYMGR